MKDLVSIIIPTYNRASIIGETLNSVLAQTYENWECIIVDDGSTDNTYELIQDYIDKDSRFRYYRSPDSHLSGASGARNYGFKKSKGEYINWLDSDDLMVSDKLEKQINVLNESKNCVVCFCKALIFNKNETYAKKSKEFGVLDLYKDHVTRQVDIGTNQPLWRHSFLEVHPLYDENIVVGEDYEFYVRIFNAVGSDYCFVPEVMVYIRNDSTGRLTELKYDKNKKDRNLMAYHKVYQYLSKKNDEGLYIYSINDLIRRFLSTARQGDVKTTIKNIRKMKETIFHEKWKYKFFFTKIILLSYFLKLTHGKGYDKLKKFYFFK
jgi:glycosyltransferase involved in cell wall biosynthesis